jgi:hypothetical protein
MPTYAKQWSLDLSTLSDQSALGTVGEASTFNFTQSGATTDVTNWTLKATLSTSIGERPVKSWTDLSFSNKTSGGAFRLSTAASDTQALASRSWLLEIRRVDVGSEAVLSRVSWTLNDSASFDEVPVASSTVLSLSRGGTEANLSATGPGVVTQTAIGGALSITPYASLPTLSGAVPTSRTLTINGTTYDLSANRSWTLDYDDVGADPAGSASAVASSLSSHTGNTSNPHSVTKSQVGLGNVDNTSDADKPVSTATQTALDAKLSLAGGTMTGNVAFSGSSVITDGTYASIDPYNRQLIAADGTVYVTYTGGTIKCWTDIVMENVSIQMKDGGVIYMPTGSRIWCDGGGAIHASENNVSIDPNNRSLNGPSGGVSLDWENDGYIIPTAPTSDPSDAGAMWKSNGFFVVSEGNPFPIGAAIGGTGRTSATAYAVVCGGTTSTGEQQSVASVGTAGQVLTSNGAGALPTFQDVSAGARNLWIPAAAMIPRVTNGPGVNASEGGSNRANYDTLDFDTTTQEYAQFMLAMPSNYSGGTVTARFFWTADSGSGTVQFQLAGRALADDDAIDTARGTAVGVSDTLITAGDLHRTAATSAITITGSPAANALVLFEVSRDVASDNLGVDARLLGVEVSF